jgi:hypothetical protein
MEREINIPKLNKEQMREIKTGLEDLLKYEINPPMTEFQPDPGDWDGWCAFEGAYEESMHKIRIHILQALNRDTRKLYGVEQVNAPLQATREQRKLLNQVDALVEILLVEIANSTCWPRSWLCVRDVW